ncbi:nuclear protein MDM1 [Vanacampus margaritifer]
MTIKSEYERSYGRSRSVSPQRGVSLAGCCTHHKARSRKDKLDHERRSSLPHPQAHSVAPRAACKKDKNQHCKRTTGLPGTDPPAGPRSEEPEPGPGSRLGREDLCTKQAEALARNATVARSPLLTAQQILRPCRRATSPFQMQPVATETKPHFAAMETQSHPITMETEYRRSFQGLSPPRGPRLRKHLERRSRVPFFHTRNRSQKMREESENMPHPQHADSTNEWEGAAHPQVQRRHRKLTEYEASFLSPLRGGVDVTPQAALLRQKASWYRQRGWGTNFSSQHLSQLRSQHNYLWEPSSDGSSDTPSPRPAPDPCIPTSDSHSPPFVEALDLASCSTSSSGPASPAHSRSLAPPTGCKTAWVAKEYEDEGDERVGRSPTPEMDSRPLRRTHLDVTTPVYGGAILVGRSNSEEAFQRLAHTPKEAPPCSSAHVRWPGSVLQCRPIVTKRSSAPPLIHVIRGRLRHAEFQHNGELGLRFRSHPGSTSYFCSDEDERLSVMSSHSLASCSAAAAVLERAQRRRREFWGGN